MLRRGHHAKQTRERDLFGTTTGRSRLFGFVAWVVVAGFPVIVLLAVQTNAQRYQSVIVTNVQRVSLLADLAVLFGSTIASGASE